MLLSDIRQLAWERLAHTIEDRRHLHAHPELSFSEKETSAFIKTRLDSLGIHWISMADTGVVATIEGGRASDRMVALRADMDALPIAELNTIDYASRNPGVMHACGHDAHTASLLTTAGILQSLKGGWAGRVRLIFQPAEEKLPGGASLMIRDGVLSDPSPAAVIGQHVMPSVAAGKIAMRSGQLMASMDEISVTVHGKGGHGAMPQLLVDPVVISAHLIVALQQIISRNNNPITPGVLSFGRVIADGAINVIPDSVQLKGTFRTVDETWRYAAHEKMKKMAEQIAEAMGGACEFEVVCGYPSLLNDPGLTHELEAIAADYLGRDCVIPTDPMMIAEDFAYYGRSAPACFYFLGTGNVEKETTAPLHSPRFNIDESALEVGAGLMAYMAIKQLEII
ncbi:MAG TPA: M20 family metallopeptidase [Puia sp.]|jgi:amidohydrolase|nr:M20 family metallopeptidase [Puia sp.]